MNEPFPITTDPKSLCDLDHCPKHCPESGKQYRKLRDWIDVEYKGHTVIEENFAALAKTFARIRIKNANARHSQ